MKMDKQLEYQPLPNWLVTVPPAPPVASRVSKAVMELEYANLFEFVIEHIYRGRSLQSLIQEDCRIVSYEHFLRWIKKDPTRKRRYEEAQEMRTEFIAGEILDIADGIERVGDDSNDTVNRDKLRIETRKWLMGAHNRKRYGESKQIEVGGSVSIVEALQQATMRVIEAEAIEVEKDEDKLA